MTEIRIDDQMEIGTQDLYAAYQVGSVVEVLKAWDYKNVRDVKAVRDKIARILRGENND